jgi:hypothetical protein
LGYLLKANDYGHYSLEITDGVWMDAIQKASEHGYSDPDLRRERGADRTLTQASADELASALNRALVAQSIEPEIGDGSTLDRDLTRRIVYILRVANREGRELQLIRTPR